MDQSRALNALEPFLALAKSANSPTAAANLISQATSAPNTFVFGELLAQPNIQALANNPENISHLTLLQTFAWGTCETYKTHTDLPALSPAQTHKLRLLSLLSIAAEKGDGTQLQYASLCKRLDLESAAELEQLVTQAIYDNLLAATLNPANQTVTITSVSPLRDLAPGSVGAMLADLEAWSNRCDSVLLDLEAEIARVKAAATRRAISDKKAEKQIRAAAEAGEKQGGGSAPAMGGGLGSNWHNTRNSKRDNGSGQDDGDEMELDGGNGMGGGGGKKRMGGIGSGLGKLRNGNK